MSSDLESSFKKLSIASKKDDKPDKKLKESGKSDKKLKESDKKLKASESDKKASESKESNKKVSETNKTKESKKKDEDLSFVLQGLSLTDITEIDKGFYASGMLTNIGKNTEKDKKTTAIKPEVNYGLELGKINFFVASNDVSNPFSSSLCKIDTKEDNIQYCIWDGCPINEKCQFPKGINVVLDKKRSYSEVKTTAINENMRNMPIYNISRTYLTKQELLRIKCKTTECLFAANPKTHLCVACMTHVTPKDTEGKKKDDGKKKKDEKKDYEEMVNTLVIDEGYKCMNCKVCSFECMKAYLESCSRIAAQNGLYCINPLYKDLTGISIYKSRDQIKAAPSKTLIKQYGGNMTVDEYRASFRKLKFTNLEHFYKTTTVMCPLFAVGILKDVK